MGAVREDRWGVPGIDRNSVCILTVQPPRLQRILACTTALGIDDCYDPDYSGFCGLLPPCVWGLLRPRLRVYDPTTTSSRALATDRYAFSPAPVSTSRPEREAAQNYCDSPPGHFRLHLAMPSAEPSLSRRPFKFEAPTSRRRQPVSPELCMPADETAGVALVSL